MMQQQGFVASFLVSFDKEMHMVTSNLMVHAGARLVDVDALKAVQAPPPEGRWFPIAHYDVLRRVREMLGEAGYEVRAEKLALSRGNNRFFGTLDLATGLGTGVTLAVGIRNSID